MPIEIELEVVTNWSPAEKESNSNYAERAGSQVNLRKAMRQ